VLPATNEVQRYEVHPPEIATRLVLLDTVGYGNAGPRDDQVKATEEAARDADLLLLALHATNPARQADLEMLQRLRQWYSSHPELRLPPVLAVMTHIDLLSPAMEWSPPYDWQHPTRPKAKSIRGAWEAVREQLGDYLVGIVPVCAAAGKVYGIDEWFLPTLAELLDEAHAVALLRCLRAEADTGKVKKVFQQLLAAGQQAAVLVWGHYKK
jgi:predicted GTPase